jgi:hypothetical protein
MTGKKNLSQVAHGSTNEVKKTCNNTSHFLLEGLELIVWRRMRGILGVARVVPALAFLVVVWELDQHGPRLIFLGGGNDEAKKTVETTDRCRRITMNCENGSTRWAWESLRKKPRW